MKIKRTVALAVVVVSREACNELKEYGLFCITPHYNLHEASTCRMQNQSCHPHVPGAWGG